MISGEWKGKFGQIAKVNDIDNDEFPYSIWIVHDGITQKVLASGKELLCRKFREKEVEFSHYLRLVIKS